MIRQLIIINVTRKLLLFITATAFQGRVGHPVHRRAFVLPNNCMCLSEFLDVDFGQSDFSARWRDSELQRKETRGISRWVKRGWVGGRDSGGGRMFQPVGGRGYQGDDLPVPLKIFHHSLLNLQNAWREWASCGYQWKTEFWDCPFVVFMVIWHTQIHQKSTEVSSCNTVKISTNVSVLLCLYSVMYNNIL